MIKPFIYFAIVFSVLIARPLFADEHINASSVAATSESSLSQSPLMLTDLSLKLWLRDELVALGPLNAQEQRQTFPAQLAELIQKNNPDTTHAADWYTLSIKNTSRTKKTWYLASPIAQATHFSIYSYSPKLDTSTVDLLQSSTSAFDSRAVHKRMLAAELELKAGEQRDVYIQYQGIVNSPLRVFIYDSRSFDQHASRYEFINGFILGVVGLAFLFFLLQFAMQPSTPIAYFCLLVFSMGFYIAQVSGYCFQYLWPNYPQFNLRLNSTVALFTYAWYFLFTFSVFDMKRHRGFLRSTLLAAAASCFLLALIGFFIDVYYPAALLAIVALPLPVIAGVWGLVHQRPMALIFLIASSIHLSTTYIFVLSTLGVNFGAFQGQVFAVSGLGQLLDICLFAGALSYRAKTMQRQLNEQHIKRIEEAENLVRLEKDNAKVHKKLDEHLLTLASTAHDLTQPIASLKMTLAVVDEHTSGAAKARMQETLVYTQSLLNSIMSNTKRDFNDNEQVHNLDQIIRTVCLRFKSKANKKSLVLRYRIHSNTLYFPGSALVLNRILDNLVNNALRFTFEGGVLITARKCKKGIKLQVWDTGVGISADKLHTIEHPFTQSESSTELAVAASVETASNSSIDQSYGLGLHIVKSLCHQEAYTFSVSSRLGRGSCFCLLIPV